MVYKNILQYNRKRRWGTYKKEIFQNIQWDKCCYEHFLKNIRNWIDIKEAHKVINRNKTHIDEDWRVCVKCWEYKIWELYNTDRSNKTTWRQSKCRECAIKDKREYREKTNYLKDKEYKQKKRKLEIWQEIMIIDQWIPETYKVVKYKFKKWYMIQSTFTQYYKRIDTNDNKKSIKFYKI